MAGPVADGPLSPRYPRINVLKRLIDKTLEQWYSIYIELLFYIDQLYFLSRGRKWDQREMSKEENANVRSNSQISIYSY